jgi:hypothetical protein
MGSSTYIRFFTSEVCSAESAIKILQSLGARSDAADVTRFNEELNSWKNRNNQDWDFPGYDYLMKRMPLSDLPSQILPGHPLSICWFADTGESPTSELRKEVWGMPEEIRGEHYPGNTGMEIGSHDIFETLETPEGTYFGKAELSVSFYGYRIPPDLNVYREKVPKLLSFNRILKLLADNFPASWKHTIHAE